MTSNEPEKPIDSMLGSNVEGALGTATQDVVWNHDHVLDLDDFSFE